ncbi:hypothetical protein [Motilibacter deserti]|uniref:Uncharacterized protein n=1 Tax=Motilibacter deserti TaxID=2714956 RepID=A0ABX0H2F0_9ACTN|nr:hypothetical protein [Motilibacter deserti]NHC16521.1 hypothetical protein [Motilibacter deserti]
MVLQPVGPESPGTYWMRRAVLLVGALVVLLLGVRACGGGSGDAAERGTGKPTPSATASGTPGSGTGGGTGDAGEAGASEDGSADASANAGDVVLDPSAVTASPTPGSSSGADDAADGSGDSAADGSGDSSTDGSGDSSTDGADDAAGTEGAACADDDLAVSAAADAASYGSGANPRLTLTIRNVSDSACTRDLGSAALELVVESGPARIWSSDDCGGKSGHTQRTLKAGESWSTSVTWSRKRSAPGCSGRAEAGDGTYVVTGRVGTATSESDRFLLK